MLNIFKEAEQSDKRNEISLLVKIFKGIIGLNDPRIIETMFGDDLFIETFGVFECTAFLHGRVLTLYIDDKDIIATNSSATSSSGKYKYREFLTKGIQFNNVVQITDMDIIKHIHLNYRLLLFKDSIAGRWIDESTIAVMSNMINGNYQDILTHIFKLETAPQEIMSKIKSDDFNNKLSGIKFLLEICNASKFMIAIENKIEFFTKLLQDDLLICLTDFFNPTLTDQNKKDQQTISPGIEEETMSYLSNLSAEFTSSHGVDRTELFQVWTGEILTNVLTALPLKVKNILLSEDDKARGRKYMTFLLEVVFTSKLDGPKYEISEFYKSLLDPESNPLKNDVFDAFYEEHVIELTEFLCTLKADPTSICLVLDLLTFCAKSHGYRMKNSVSHNNVLKDLEQLYYHSSKHIRLAMVKFLKTLIGTKDESMCKYISGNDLMKPVISLANKVKRDNMILSAILEIFDIIQKENLKILISYLAEKHMDFIESGPLSHNKALKGIKIKYEQHTEGEEVAAKFSESEK